MTTLRTVLAIRSITYCCRPKKNFVAEFVWYLQKKINRIRVKQCKPLRPLWVL